MQFCNCWPTTGSHELAHNLSGEPAGISSLIQRWRMKAKTGGSRITRSIFRPTNMLLSSFLSVAVPLATLLFIARMSVFGRVKIELGFDHYAEKADQNSLLKMPANACINAGYCLVGLYWILITKKREHKLKDQAFFYYTLSWMAVFYGPVQLARIVFQTRWFGVMDQWCTLPFFAWIACWNEFVYRAHVWQASRYLSAIRISLLSYFLVFLHDVGFEVALGLHIVTVLLYTYRTQSRLGTTKSRLYFVLALLCCTGFVLLKLCDHHLARYEMFRRFTGHFWSKVCDVAQLHFALRYFEALQQPNTKKAAK